MERALRFLAAAFAPLLAALLLSTAAGAADTGARIVNAGKEPQNWLTHGLNYQETRNSPLTTIDTTNVARLGLLWSYDLDTHRGQEATPIVVDGHFYTTSAWSKVQAFDAVSGKLLWQFDPHVPGATGAKACCDVVNRGLAFWNGRLYLGTLDGRLIALDAGTGQEVWSVATVDAAENHTITGAPRIVKGKVLIGNGGAEYSTRGYISAYDADSGKLVWRFYTVPGQPGHADHAASDKVLAEVAAPTWTGDWWSEANGGGGGTVWDSMSYDPDLDLLYFGVGNGAYWNQKLRSPGGGDNLFVSSIVAVKPDTGTYVWHFQETPGDQWDFDADQHLILADLTIDGKPRKALMQAAKNGFFYVLDRASGKLISATPYSPMTWATGIDEKTGRPIMNPDADYSKTGKIWSSVPGALGAHNWQPMAFNAATGLVYIPAQELGFVEAPDTEFKPLRKGMNSGVDFSKAVLPDDPAIQAEVKKTLKGYLIAWDPIARKEVWRANHSGPWNGGVLSTAGGLVFQGDGDGNLNAYDAKSGAKLWSFQTQTGILAPPVTYAVGGVQYVTVVVGWGGAFGMYGGALAWGPDGVIVNRSRVLTFALDAKASLPAVAKSDTSIPAPPTQFATPEVVKLGEAAYDRVCLVCHGGGAIGGGITPDLRHSQALGDAATWRSIVADGTLTDHGMISFKEDYSLDQIEAIRAYVVSRAITEASGKPKAP